MKHWKHWLGQQWAIANYNKNYTLIALFSFVGIAIFIHMINGPRQLLNLPDQIIYAQYIDPILAISTFIITLILGYQNKRRAWEENLEKRLSICFLYEYDAAPYRHLKDETSFDLKRQVIEQTQLIKEIEQRLKKLQQTQANSPHTWQQHFDKIAA